MFNLNLIAKKVLMGIVLIILSLPFLESPLLAYEVFSIEDGGELYGTIKFKGKPPFNQSHTVVNNPDYCGEVVQEETYMVNPNNQGLKNVIISIEGIQKGKKEFVSTIVVENRKCHFTPHVMAGMAGDFYEIVNSDPILHNTHMYLEDLSLVNVAMPPKGKNIKRSITKPGIIKVKCDAHKFMQGWIVVTDNPYSAISDEEGKYRISDIPPGGYKIKVWHEGISAKEKEITILKGKKTELSFELGLDNP